MMRAKQTTKAVSEDISGCASAEEVDDLFEEEVERRVRSDFECRTEEQVAEYYSAAVRGTDDSRSRGR